MPWASGVLWMMNDVGNFVSAGPEQTVVNHCAGTIFYRGGLAVANEQSSFCGERFWYRLLQKVVSWVDEGICQKYHRWGVGYCRLGAMQAAVEVLIFTIYGIGTSFETETAIMRCSSHFLFFRHKHSFPAHISPFLSDRSRDPSLCELGQVRQFHNWWEIGKKNSLQWPLTTCSLETVDEQV